MGTLALFYYFVCLTICSGFVFTPKEAPQYEKVFLPRPVGWLGADVSTSVHLRDDLYIWIWGDTLVGNLFVNSTHNEERNITRMPHNTLALVDMKNPTANFIIPNQNRGFFYPKYESDQDFYWVIDAKIGPKSQKLIFTAMVITSVSTPPGFEQTRTDIIVVHNPFDSPERWQWESFPVPSTKKDYFWSASIFADGNFIYLVGTYPGGQSLARIPENDLVQKDFSHMQFWGQGQWQTNINAVSPFIKGPFTFTETTVIFHPFMKKWYMVCSQAYSSYIYIALSDSITGPWETANVYVIPPPWNNGSIYLNYAAKSHPEWQTQENQIVFTYNTNSVSGLQGLRYEVDAYHPHFVILTITQ